MIAKASPSLIEPQTVSGRLADVCFRGSDLFGRGQHGLLVLTRDHDHAVGVAAQDVSGLHARSADRNIDVDAFDLHAVLARAHPTPTAIDGVAERLAQRHITIDAIDYCAGKSASVGDLGEDVAPDGEVLAAAEIEHDDSADRYIIDIVTDRARGFGGRPVEKRECPARHPKRRRAGADAGALAKHAK